MLDIFNTKQFSFRLPHPRQWPGRAIRTVGDGPLVCLPERWRKRLRSPWKLWSVRLVDSWVLAPWAMFILGLHRPPERLMTAAEHALVVENNMVIGAHRRNPKWVRLYDLWRRTWLRAQLADDMRARQRLGLEAG